jgi:hypothetical protein
MSFAAQESQPSWVFIVVLVAATAALVLTGLLGAVLTLTHR